jgi:anthranilate synthase component 1
MQLSRARAKQSSAGRIDFHLPGTKVQVSQAQRVVYVQTFAQFETLAAEYNVIPMVREVLADFETPIALAARLQQQSRCFLLESVEGGETWGRFSILGFDVDTHVEIRDGQAIVVKKGVETALAGNPIDALQSYLAGFSVAPLPDLRFAGGAVGYFSFETVRFFERCGTVHDSDGRFPDAFFVMADHLAVFDTIRHTLRLICCVHRDDFVDLASAYAYGQQTLDRLEGIIRQPLQTPQPVTSDRELKMKSNMSEAAFEEVVRRAKDYIRDGDIIQVVLAQHFSCDIDAAPLDVYRALRYINPSPYLFYFKLDDQRAIAGSSPEVMVRVTGSKAEIRPIAGTRPRGASAEADQALAEDLLADPKERAEHVMLVDLARNDLGRIAEIGSVVVEDYMFIERYSHVMHLVSQVEATVRDGLDSLDVLKASFPAGTLSGAPKVRAMEIINELEPQARGPYGGALGYIGYGGQNMDMAITIRTLVIDQGRATVTAGAGIVHDSVPEREFAETCHKSAGMKRALALANCGLRIDEVDR